MPIPMQLMPGIGAEPFRSIYYLGSKASIVRHIADAINELDPSNGPMLDLFSGGGAVSSVLAQQRPVTAVDIQEYSRVLCSAVLRPWRATDAALNEIVESELTGTRHVQLATVLAPLIDLENRCIADALRGDVAPLVEFLDSEPLAALVDSQLRIDSKTNTIKRSVIASLEESGLWDSPLTTVTRNFGGLYFSFKQAMDLDLLLDRANRMPAETRDTLVASLLCTASQIVNSVGKQFAQPLRPRDRSGKVKAGLTKVVERDRSYAVRTIFLEWCARYASLHEKIGSRAICSGYQRALSGFGADHTVAYADPPYTRDHYSRFYHVLETMCLRDDSSMSTVFFHGQRKVSRGAYRHDRHQSPFCIRSEAPKAFEELFRGCHDANLPLVLSYSPHESGDGTHPRVVAISTILEIAQDIYPRVTISAIGGSTHNQLNKSELKLKAREYSEVLVKCFR